MPLGPRSWSHAGRAARGASRRRAAHAVSATPASGSRGGLCESAGARRDVKSIGGNQAAAVQRFDDEDHRLVACIAAFVHGELRERSVCGEGQRNSNLHSRKRRRSAATKRRESKPNAPRRPRARSVAGATGRAGHVGERFAQAALVDAQLGCDRRDGDHAVLLPQPHDGRPDHLDQFHERGGYLRPPARRG